MSNSSDIQFGYTDGDVDTNLTAGPTLNDLVAQRYSRRQTLRSGAVATAAAVFGGSMLAGCDNSALPADPAPAMSVGQAGTARAGNVVTLTATAYDNGTITGYSYSQLSGPAVTLVNAGTAECNFIAPAVSAATPLVFRTSVTDDSGNVVTVDTTVTIQPAALGFTAVAKNKLDVVTVPAGYKVQIGARLGDPIATGVAAFANDGTDGNYAQRIGDHGDALYWYGLNTAGGRDDNSSFRGLIVQNHENINQQYLHPAGPTAPGGIRPEAEAIKEIECHGVSVVEYVEGANRSWSYVQNSSFNRRVTPNTPATFSGPAAGSALLKTAYSTNGTAGRGTLNNCANGHTGWGTNLTCEENWAGYFKRGAGDNANRTAREVTQLNRYGISQGAAGSYGWATVVPADPANTSFRRFDLTVDTTKPADGTGDYRYEANQFGWVVEIDPYDRTIAPRKRTALGRMGHEGAWLSKTIAGKKLAVYLGDDARGEYLYKFVSNVAWSDADAQAANRIAIGDKYLDAGTLYVAKFNADGTGNWLPLVFGSVPDRPAVGADPVYVFQDQADILANARLAGDALGATKMDRPEWTAVNPVNGEVYLTLTNNNASVRPLNGTDAANPRHYNDPKGATNQFGNPNGHIIRLRETGDDPAATGFTWDIYLFGAGSDLDPANINISGLTADNDFSSPDGLWFGRPQNASGLVKPVLWIQTDDGAYTDVTNCMMLAAMPGTVGDGGARTITNTGSGGATATQATRVGAPATAATLKRFLVGPVECEITGVDTTPDGRTLFVGIQHPGENGTPAAPSSHWPASQASGSAGATVRPRSAIAIITKNDGGVVAL
ncbi:alkaline phosphatase PhoX [Sphingomonas canadensis]|uniref:Alkaline phosphatase PhoX n=1 Tax=Sphingomonas canadensis TaxID=1219257 RepID=A0ABW3H2V4_9SPHN|nr:PhoX family phosphatase [Sphingomonas canadensis]MCW3835737.1 PhoX family phosphatase [Sphingomonas canadensis]